MHCGYPQHQRLSCAQPSTLKHREVSTWVRTMSNNWIWNPRTPRFKFSLLLGGIDNPNNSLKQDHLILQAFSTIKTLQWILYWISSIQFSSLQLLSRVLLFATPWTAARQASLSITNSGVYSNSIPLSQWCHPTISSSVVPFSSCPQSFPASGSFQMSQLFASSGLSIGVSALTSVLPINTQGWSPLGWTGWISLLSKGLSRVFSNTTVQKHLFFGAQLFYSPTFTSIHVGTTEYQNVQKLMYESGESESVSYSVMPNSLQPHEL